MKEYDEDEFLMLSGIQHFAFCPRQWALIHVEQQWKENYFTVDGKLMHENAHDREFTEKRGNILITRGLNVFSRMLGISGSCDVVEFHKCKVGIALHGYEGQFQPMPIEYKRGKPKAHDADELQLCAQAMCLEEMLVCPISKGFLYYGEPKKRTEVCLESGLRERVITCYERMHELFNKQHTPGAKPSKSCSACSLVDICLPKLSKRLSVADYMERELSAGSKEELR